jgi:hypothetical protein
MPEHRGLAPDGVIALLLRTDTSCDQPCDHEGPEHAESPSEEGL